MTATGTEQARLLGEKIADWAIDTCYTSDSPRALTTAQLVTKQLAVTPRTDTRLREIGMGTWEGRTRQEIQTTDTEEWQQFWETPHLFQGRNGGETFTTLNNRSHASITDMMTQHAGETILVVSHRLTIKTIINQLLGHDIAQLTTLADVEPNSLSLIELTDGRIQVPLYSDISHYQ